MVFDYCFVFIPKPQGGSREPLFKLGVRGLSVKGPYFLIWKENVKSNKGLFLLSEHIFSEQLYNCMNTPVTIQMTPWIAFIAKISFSSICSTLK